MKHYHHPIPPYTIHPVAPHKHPTPPYKYPQAPLHPLIHIHKTLSPPLHIQYQHPIPPHTTPLHPVPPHPTYNTTPHTIPYPQAPHTPTYMGVWFSGVTFIYLFMELFLVGCFFALRGFYFHVSSSVYYLYIILFIIYAILLFCL